MMPWPHLGPSPCHQRGDEEIVAGANLPRPVNLGEVHEPLGRCESEERQQADLSGVGGRLIGKSLP